MKLDVRPVGWVRNRIEGPKHEGWQEVVSEIEVEPELAECLEGIEGFSHIQVLFWFHKLSAKERAMRKFHPRDREDLPIVGSFATRSQRRPNPIGLTTARLLERNGNVLRVQGLDALDGTPVLDIKPYSRGLDEAEEVRVPEWVERFWEEGRGKK
ncbi:MAG: tRNA (N6-threonylcarbamoyladenosine(37)-N6)-methyltransferase TrmO [Chloroflexi bacterium]|nr:tRNA (N6-threonylcarbamoyladenosine(37)-N6)-methyltransferase TrmO [Chloroflexota bacterium]